VRLVLGDHVLREVVSALGYCAYQDALSALARQAIEIGYLRAQAQLLPSLMLSTKALVHLLDAKRNRV
jgi:Hyccin